MFMGNVPLRGLAKQHDDLLHDIVLLHRLHRHHGAHITGGRIHYKIIYCEIPTSLNLEIESIHG